MHSQIEKHGRVSHHSQQGMALAAHPHRAAAGAPLTVREPSLQVAT